jgi:transcriptional regulator with XRE-family HTH domain
MTSSKDGKPESTYSEMGKLGERLRQRRKALKMTLKDVAERSSLTTGFISQIERDITTPSLTSLSNVCRALDMDVSEFLNFQTSEDSQQSQDAPLLFGIGKVSPEVVTYERLTASFPNNVLRATFIHEPAGYRSEAMSHEGEEIFYIVSGELTLEVSGQPTVLREGDTAHFPSKLSHRTWNHTDNPTTVFHVCTMDVFGQVNGTTEVTTQGLAVTRRLPVSPTHHSSSTKGED